MLTGGAFATFKDAVNCCVATLPAEAVKVAEKVAATVETLACELAEAVVAVTVLA